MGKVVKFEPVRTGRAHREDGGVTVARDRCPRCGHRFDVHIRHPDGILACAARGCGCQSARS